MAMACVSGNNSLSSIRSPFSKSLIKLRRTALSPLPLSFRIRREGCMFVAAEKPKCKGQVNASLSDDTRACRRLAAEPGGLTSEVPSAALATLVIAVTGGTVYNPCRSKEDNYRDNQKNCDCRNDCALLPRNRGRCLCARGRRGIPDQAAAGRVDQGTNE